MINPFVEVYGLELFGMLEWVEGRGQGASTNRNVSQYGVEAVYRFLNDDLYVGGRYNVLDGEVLALDQDVSVDRIQVGGGWFITENGLLKGEYMVQNYNDYPTTSVFHDGQFEGFMLEGVVVF